ncbi:MAG: DUF4259 domain-containing protein [Phycisphaerales bacterium]|nr:DUF4259 domain-containing protein [Phycisphaerales bacterium]
MGAWGFGPFDNDDALDWLGQFLEAADSGVAWLPFARSKPAMLRRALRRPRRNKHLDLGVVECAVAACEVIATQLGRPGASIPAELAERVAGLGLDVRSVRSQAEAVARFLRDAPAYRELFLDESDYPTWQANMDDLISRLR